MVKFLKENWFKLSILLIVLFFCIILLLAVFILTDLPLVKV